jgi:hypothetical protein
MEYVMDIKNINCREKNAYAIANAYLGKIFSDFGKELQGVRASALKVKTGVEKISIFIQQATRITCPDCEDVCCIGKHGYYNFEDLVYLHALGLKPPPLEFEKNDNDPCRFLTEKGCSIERQFRPSGCNWYFCGALFDYMENKPEYQEFDDTLTNIAALWLKMIEEFTSEVETIKEQVQINS